MNTSTRPRIKTLAEIEEMMVERRSNRPSKPTPAQEAVTCPACSECGGPLDARVDTSGFGGASSTHRDPHVCVRYLKMALGAARKASK